MPRRKASDLARNTPERCYPGWGVHKGAADLLRCHWRRVIVREYFPPDDGPPACLVEYMLDDIGRQRVLVARGQTWEEALGQIPDEWHINLCYDANYRKTKQ
jgi:hypothetical protein